MGECLSHGELEIRKLKADDVRAGLLPRKSFRHRWPGVPKLGDSANSESPSVKPSWCAQRLGCGALVLIPCRFYLLTMRTLKCTSVDHMWLTKTQIYWPKYPISIACPNNTPALGPFKKHLSVTSIQYGNRFAPHWSKPMFIRQMRRCRRSSFHVPASSLVR